VLKSWDALQEYFLTITKSPDIKVGSYSKVAPGAGKTKNISDHITVIGIPAKPRI